MPRFAQIRDYDAELEYNAFGGVRFEGSLIEMERIGDGRDPNFLVFFISDVQRIMYYGEGESPNHAMQFIRDRVQEHNATITVDDYDAGHGGITDPVRFLEGNHPDGFDEGNDMMID